MLLKKIENFKNPGKEFRGAPFWAWNASLEPEKLRKQIRIMKSMGFGGFYMHSRTGLDTAYLGEKWFECISACIDEAEKQNMQPWLYDEDRWPSGACGGAVTSDDNCKARKLWYCKGEAPEKEKMLARFALILEGKSLRSMRRLKNGENPSENESLYSFYWQFMECSSWYNGNCYLDTLNKKAVEKFIRSTHQVYFEKYGKLFGDPIAGIFTDEPCYIHGEVALCLPWTECIPESFLQKYSYDLLDFIPELFFETSLEVSHTRHDYYDLLTNLFVTAFSGSIGNWCREHSLPLTGHLLGEDLLSTQTLYVGSAMPFYEHMQIPGIDILTEHWNIFNTIKQCTSMTHQLEKKRCLTESYACTGWDFPLAGHRAICDWQFAMGVNQRCLHLSWYSMEAEGKRDYPASISDHSPWFEKYSLIEDHFARLSALISDGSVIRDLLIIHPIESLWSIMVKDVPSDPIEQERRKIKKGTKALEEFYSPKVNLLDQLHVDLTNLLLRENMDFDFGDESLLPRFAKVEKECFKVGAAEYKMVLLPEMKTIRKSTLELLEKFEGKVFYLGKIPQFVDAQISEEAERVYAKFIPVTRETLVRKLAENFRRVSICDADGKEAEAVLYRLADCGDHHTFFLCNTSMPFISKQKAAPLVHERNIAYPCLRIEFVSERKGNLYEFDLENGKIYSVKTCYEKGKYFFETSLASLETRFFVLTEKFLTSDEPPPPLHAEKFLHKVEFKDAPLSLEEDNVFVLDHAAWQVDGIAHEKEYILFIDDQLRDHLKEPHRGGLMCQPWCADKKKPYKNADLVLKYDFICDEVPNEDCTLVLEHPELFRIILNGQNVENISCGFWLDEAMQKIRLPKSLLRRGENILQLSTIYNCAQRGLEVVYLCGKFGVKDQHITPFPRTLSPGDWCMQGLENYAGNLTIHLALNEKAPCIFKPGKWRSSLLGIRVNGGAEQLFLTQDFLLELPAGKCLLDITFYGHRRNALGPFYLNEKWPIRTGPQQYKNYEQKERQLVPCGFLEPPEIWSKGTAAKSPAKKDSF